MSAFARWLSLLSIALVLACAGRAAARSATLDTRHWNDLNLSPPCANGRAFQPFCDRIESSPREQHHRARVVKLRHNFLPELQKSVDNL